MHYDWAKEVKWSEYVQQVIVDKLGMNKDKSNELHKKMREINKEMWEDVGPLAGFSSFFRIPTFVQEIDFLRQNLSDTVRNKKEIKKLERQISSPYFCRIDFKEADCCIESMYIGIYGLRREDCNEIVIYDWRAPVSSIFYDSEVGPASYQCPSGCIEGELLLKRQFKIERGKLLSIFDSSVAINDSILQDILAESADNRMKTIVSTIQREQYRAIRCENKRVLSVQGGAGSGKTSIALHRAAFLLYRHRNAIKSDNIQLFTPNGIFAKYISNVLPELGEDDIPSNTLTKLVQGNLGVLFSKYETYSEMLEWQLLQSDSNEVDSWIECIAFKASKVFTNILESFVKDFKSKIVHFEDIIVRNTVLVTKDELEELFYNSFSHMPIAKRLSRIETCVMIRINEYLNQREIGKVSKLENTDEYVDSRETKVKSHFAITNEIESTMKNVKRMFSIDIVSLYQILFKDPVVWNLYDGSLLYEASRMRTVEAIENGILLYEDQSPILYLMILLGMVDMDKETKHVIIDEAQDYSYITFKLFSKLYSTCGITLLGDACQNISPASGIGNLQLAGEILDPNSYEYIELDKGYRSTVEIMEFASKILSSRVIPFGRHGKIPRLLVSETADDVCKLISDCVDDAKRDNFNSLAIICRTLSSCQHVYRYFVAKDLTINLIKNGDDEILSRIIIIPSYLAKGLEFDAVIAAVLSTDEYDFNEDQLFYTVCTRALHKLDVCSVEKAGILDKFKS